MSWDVSLLVNFGLILCGCRVLETLLFTLRIFLKIIFNIYTVINGNFHREEFAIEAYQYCTHIFTSTLGSGFLSLLVSSFICGRDREGLGVGILLISSRNEHLTVRVVVA